MVQGSAGRYFQKMIFGVTNKGNCGMKAGSNRLGGGLIKISKSRTTYQVDSAEFAASQKILPNLTRVLHNTVCPLRLGNGEWREIAAVFGKSKPPIGLQNEG